MRPVILGAAATLDIEKICRHRLGIVDVPVAFTRHHVIHEHGVARIVGVGESKIRHRGLRDFSGFVPISSRNSLDLPLIATATVLRSLSGAFFRSAESATDGMAQIGAFGLAAVCAAGAGEIFGPGWAGGGSFDATGTGVSGVSVGNNADKSGDGITSFSAWLCTSSFSAWLFAFASV